MAITVETNINGNDRYDEYDAETAKDAVLAAIEDEAYYREARIANHDPIIGDGDYISATDEDGNGARATYDDGTWTMTLTDDDGNVTDEYVM